MMVYDDLMIYCDPYINSWSMWPMAWHALDIFAWLWPSSPLPRWRPSWRRVRPTRLADGWWLSPRWASPMEVQQKLFFERPKKLQNCHKCWQSCHFDLSNFIKSASCWESFKYLWMISKNSIKSLKLRSNSVFARQDSDQDIRRRMLQSHNPGCFVPLTTLWTVGVFILTWRITRRSFHCNYAMVSKVLEVRSSCKKMWKRTKKVKTKWIILFPCWSSLLPLCCFLFSVKLSYRIWSRDVWHPKVGSVQTMPGRYENYDLTALYNTSKLLESRSGGEDEVSQIFCDTNWKIFNLGRCNQPLLLQLPQFAT